MKSRLDKLNNTFFPHPLPWMRIYIFLGIWVFVDKLNYFLIHALKINTGTPDNFPFSVFSLSFQITGLKYALFFMIIVFLVLRYKIYKNIFITYLIGLTLIVLGNMSLGNIDLAFVNPIAGGKIQYYHDVLKIDSWQVWLSNFNVAQESLLCHARTHPPGALLIQKALFIVSSSPKWISIAFLLLSSISIVLVYKMFIELGRDNVFANKMSLLYVVIPSVNIYSLATLDAIIAMLINIVILGVIIIIESKDKKRVVVWGILSALSIISTSFLTFGSIYLWAVLGGFSLYLLYFYKNIKLLILLSSTFLLFLLAMLFLYQAYGYNYIESFLTASKLENPHGFILFSNPSLYLATRIEDIFEIAIFLSFGVLAVLTTIKYKLQNNIYMMFSLIAISILVLMFLSGAYRTGETARACLFIVGFILILLKDIPSNEINSLISFAAIQTIFMQIIGSYFW